MSTTFYSSYPTQTPSSGAGPKPGLSKTVLAVVIIAIILVGVAIVVGAALVLSPSLSVNTKNFAPYTSTVSKDSNNPSSLSVTNTNGEVDMSPWSQDYLMINGTVTARGIGANPDTITFTKSNSSGNIIFEAVFPPGTFFFSTGYTVDIHIYFPAAAQFKTVQCTDVNGNIVVSGVNASSVTITGTNGKISANSIVSSSLTLTDTNGGIDFTCSCGGVKAVTTNGSVSGTLTSSLEAGSYSLISTNGSISLNLPITGSYRVTANSSFGSVSGVGISIQNHGTATIGLGAATVTLTTTNGSISVTAT